MGSPGLVFEKRPFLIISAPSTLAYNQTFVSDGGCIVLIDNHSLDRCSLMFATPIYSTARQQNESQCHDWVTGAVRRISAALERATAGAQKKVSDTVARRGRGHQCRAAAGAGSKLLRGRRRRCTLVAAIDQGSSAAGKRWRGQAEERYGGKDGELHDLPPLSR
jgi:hypothetical protein